jgi:benzoylformate decarboxylase
MTGKLGRDVVFDYLRDLGVACLFGVPGTNEIPLIDGTSVHDSGVTYVPCLHENIAVGAAMGYARASGRPGVVELHVTPGAAHGIGNLYNAYKSHVPVVVLCAQQHTELLAQEPLLASDLVQVARQYTKWAYEVRFPDELPLVLQRAFKEALAPPTRPVFLAIPWEFTLAPVQDAPPRVTRVARHFLGDREAIAHAAERLATAKSPVIVAGDGVGAAGAWAELARLAELLGAAVYSESLSSYMNFPNHLPRWQGELPQTQAAMQAVFKDHDVAFLCGYNAQAQVLVFRYALGPMIPRDVAQVYLHDDEWEIGKNDYGEVAILGDIKVTLPVLCDGVAAHRGRDAAAVAAREAELERLAEQRGAQLDARRRALADQPPGSPITGEAVAVAVAGLQDAMDAPLALVNEAVSDSKWFQTYPSYARPEDYFFAQGGSLGFSMPASLGVKLATGRERTVVNVVGDGSALFYPHTWWTARKLELPILYVITNNREYKTLQLGLELVEQIYEWQPAGDAWYLRLDQPPVMSFAELAAPFGLAGELVSNPADLVGALRRGLDAVQSGRSFVLDVLTDPSLAAPPQPPPRVDALMASKEGHDDGRVTRHRQLGPA